MEKKQKHYKTLKEIKLKSRIDPWKKIFRCQKCSPWMKKVPSRLADSESIQQKKKEISWRN
jgi:hypothetical protein